MNKNCVLGQYLKNIRFAMSKIGYSNVEIRDFLLNCLFSVFCENCNLFLGRPFSAIIFNSLSHELGSKLTAFFRTLPPTFNQMEEPLQLNSDIQNKLIMFISEDWSNVSVSEFGEIYLSAEEQIDRGAFYTADTEIDMILDNLFLNKMSSDPIETIAKLPNTRFLDPACGCGNFLIRTIERLAELEISLGIPHKSSWICIDNFFGIEIDDLSAQVARTALFIQVRRSQIDFAYAYGDLASLDIELPKNIFCENALKMDWDKLNPCYIIGNPPFLSQLTAHQREDLLSVTRTLNKIDYSAAWIIKAAECICVTNAKCGYLLTSSVCQGIQVQSIWEQISKIIKIDFAYKPFKWYQEDSSYAQVWCVIIGFSSIRTIHEAKLLYPAPDIPPKRCNHINAYLNDDADMFLTPSFSQKSNYPEMHQGRCVVQNIFEHQTFFNKLAQISYKPEYSSYVTADSLLKSEKLYCFEKEHIKSSNYIVIPRHSSEQRRYIPIGYYENTSIRCNSSVHYIANADLFLFGLLSSSVHMAFMRYFSGRLEMRYRYSSSLIYNNMYIPKPSKEQHSFISKTAKEILILRKKYSSNFTLGDMYKNMPDELMRAHRKLDCLVDKLYNDGKLFSSDRHRVLFLYDKYKKVCVTCDTASSERR